MNSPFLIIEPRKSYFTTTSTFCLPARHLVLFKRIFQSKKVLVSETSYFVKCQISNSSNNLYINCRMSLLASIPIALHCTPHATGEARALVLKDKVGCLSMSYTHSSTVFTYPIGQTLVGEGCDNFALESQLYLPLRLTPAGPVIVLGYFSGGWEINPLQPAWLWGDCDKRSLPTGAITLLRS